MENTSYLKIYKLDEEPLLSKVNYSEIKRYAGMMGKSDSEIETDSMHSLMNDCINEVMPLLTYRVSYLVVDGTDLPFDTQGSKNLSQNLKGCDRTVLFAATIGPAIDRLINRYSRISPAKALFLQAIGAERIEALCDLFCDEIRHGRIENLDGEHIYGTHPRYSPGYGDLPLDVQREFFGLLDCNRKLGLTLNESLLMSPSKSVTAIVGVETNMIGIDHDSIAKDWILCEESLTGSMHNCRACSLENCAYREDM